jgi:hypothetical protein
MRSAFQLALQMVLACVAGFLALLTGIELSYERVGHAVLVGIAAWCFWLLAKEVESVRRGVFRP